MPLKPDMNLWSVALLTAAIKALRAWCQTSPSGSAVALISALKLLTCQKIDPSNKSLTLSLVRTSYLKNICRARMSTFVTNTLDGDCCSGDCEKLDQCISTMWWYGGKKNAVPSPFPPPPP